MISSFISSFVSYVEIKTSQSYLSNKLFLIDSKQSEYVLVSP